MVKLSGEDTLLYQIKQADLLTPDREYRFHDTRRWRFDFAYPDKKIAIEVEGGVYRGGRHTRGKGFTNDCVKYNTANELGWTVYRYTTEQVQKGEAINQLKRVLNA